ncbi:MAG TPA: beta-eliminating lyase-related protein [Trebonia sp.]|nr:beta-eliminating lyase-related protein [Trebonia sp.]
MPSDDLATRIRAASRYCTAAVSGHAFRSPAQAFQDLARACDELGIEEWDSYGEHGAVERLEAELVALFGVEAAAFFPSGVMAQQAALRIHTDRAGSRRVAMPDLSHLLVHEEDGPRVLHGLEISFLTQGFETPAARHVDVLPGRVGAVLVELPLRDAGCLLPTWDELTALSESCRARGTALHFDGARIWESRPWFDRTLPEIAALADSLYVSFYKGLEGLAGAALLGPADFIAEARLWRRRLGGTIYRTTAEAVSALVGLRDRLPIVADTVAWARAFAAQLPSYVTVQPGVPHTNQFRLYAAGEADTVNERVLASVAEHHISLPAWRAAQEPGRITTEIVVTGAALGLEPAEMAAFLGSVIISAGLPLRAARSHHPMTSVVPFEYMSHVLTIPVRVGDIETRFIFDTGIGLNLISEDLANRVGCHPDGSTFTGRRMSGQAVTVPLGSLGSLDIGASRGRDIPVGIFDMHTAAGLGDVEGFVSLSCFLTTPVTADYSARLGS